VAGVLILGAPGVSVLGGGNVAAEIESWFGSMPIMGLQHVNAVTKIKMLMPNNLPGWVIASSFSHSKQLAFFS
jgi:hypothetical protein